MNRLGSHKNSDALVFVGHPIVTGEARYVVPRDFERAAGFEVVKAAPG
jgi:hypothetical protein